MKRFAVRTLVVALALAAGTASAQSYYDGGDTAYAQDDRYAQQDPGYYDAQDSGYYDAQDPGYYDNQGATGYTAAQGPAYSDGREAYAAEGAAYDVARVISVDPMVQPGQPVQRQVCQNEPVQTYARNGYPAPQRTSGGGAIIGAILGGVIGNTIAKDNGHRHGGYYRRGYHGGYHNGSSNRDAATVAGAVIGGVIGNGIERNNQYRAQNTSQYVQREVQRCRVVTEYQDDERVVGYRVGYEYAGRRFETVTDYHPGSEIRVRVQVTPDL